MQIEAPCQCWKQKRKVVLPTFWFPLRLGFVYMFVYARQYFHGNRATLNIFRHFNFKSCYDYDNGRNVWFIHVSFWQVAISNLHCVQKSNTQLDKASIVTKL